MSKADSEANTIKRALEILLTPDGKGRKQKAIVLSELCCTINGNKVRESIKELTSTLT